MEHRFSQGATFAVQSAYADLLDLIAASAPGCTEAEVYELCREAERTPLAMMAVVIVADGNLGPEEAEFLTPGC